MSTITFDYLKNQLNLVTTCAQWSYNEWGHYTPDRSLDDFISSRKAYTQYTKWTMVSPASHPIVLQFHHSPKQWEQVWNANTGK